MRDLLPFRHFFPKKQRSPCRPARAQGTDTRWTAIGNDSSRRAVVVEISRETATVDGELVLLERFESTEWNTNTTSNTSAQVHRECHSK